MTSRIPEPGRDGVRWFAGRSRLGSHLVVHAVSKAASSFGTRDDAEAARVEAQDANLPGYTGRAYTIRSLCGVSEPRSGTVPFDPSADGACDTCARLFTSRSAPDVPGWTVRCAGPCGQDLPVNRYATDRRRKSGLAAACTDCRRMLARQRRADRDSARSAARQAERAVQVLAAVRAQAATVEAFLLDPDWPAVDCRVDPAHGTLTAGVFDGDGRRMARTVLSCGECALTWTPDQHLMALVRAWSELDGPPGDCVEAFDPAPFPNGRT